MTESTFELSFRDLAFYIRKDFEANIGSFSRLSLILNVLKGNLFSFIFWLRVTSYCNKKVVVLYYVARLFYIKYKIKYGLDIHYGTPIGFGLKINHFGRIIINKNCVIGSNCIVSSGVVLGVKNIGNKGGCPIIKDNVTLCIDAKVFGDVIIDNNCIVGSGVIVTESVSENKFVKYKQNINVIDRN